MHQEGYSALAYAMSKASRLRHDWHALSVYLAGVSASLMLNNNRLETAVCCRQETPHSLLQSRTFCLSCSNTFFSIIQINKRLVPISQGSIYVTVFNYCSILDYQLKFTHALITANTVNIKLFATKPSCLKFICFKYDWYGSQSGRMVK